MTTLRMVATLLLLFTLTPAGIGAQAPATGDSAPLIGVWIHAKDPAGKLKMDPIYEGSTITFEADGNYAFKLGGNSRPLVGKWELRGAKGDTIRIHNDYGNGRTVDQTVTLRRDGKKAVTGFYVVEADMGPETGRYYAKK